MWALLVVTLFGCQDFQCSCPEGRVERGTWSLHADQAATNGDVVIDQDTVIVTWTDDAGQLWEAEYAIVAE